MRLTYLLEYRQNDLINYFIVDNGGYRVVEPSKDLELVLEKANFLGMKPLKAIPDDVFLRARERNEPPYNVYPYTQQRKTKSDSEK